MLALAGCGIWDSPKNPFVAAKIQRGINVDPNTIKQFVPGTTTRADVQSLLGTPTAKGSFDDNTWIYVAETTQARIGRLPGVNNQNVVVLNFDDNGVLKDVKSLNKDDSQDVDVIARTTPSPGTEASVLQQLLGNIGKFNPTGLGNAGGGGGVNGPGL